MFFSVYWGNFDGLYGPNMESKLHMLNMYLLKVLNIMVRISLNEVL